MDTRSGGRLPGGGACGRRRHGGRDAPPDCRACPSRCRPPRCTRWRTRCADAAGTAEDIARPPADRGDDVGADCRRRRRRSSTATGRRRRALAGELGWLGDTVAAVADSWLALDGALLAAHGRARADDHHAAGPAPARPCRRGTRTALDDLVRDVAGGGVRASAVVDERRWAARPRRHRGWLGADARPLRPRRSARRRPRARSSAALVPADRAAGGARASCSGDPRPASVRPRAEQDEDFARGLGPAGRRSTDPAPAMHDRRPAAVGRRPRSSGRRGGPPSRHAALLDGAGRTTRRATAHVLAGVQRRRSAAPAAPGDAGRAVAYLAVRCPAGATRNWPPGASSSRPAALLGGATPEEREALAATLLAFAEHPAFARCTTRGGWAPRAWSCCSSPRVGHVRADRPWPRCWRRRWAAATCRPDGRRPGRGGPRRHVRASRRPERRSDAVAAGMAAVLLPVPPGPSGGLRPETVARWAGQLLLREHAQGVTRARVRCPAVLATVRVRSRRAGRRILADGGEPAAGRALLASTGIWQALLARFWADGGAALGELITVGRRGQQACPGSDGGARRADGDRRRPVRGGPHRLDGRPRHRGRRRARTRRAVAAHVGVAVDALVGRRRRLALRRYRGRAARPGLRDGRPGRAARGRGGARRLEPRPAVPCRRTALLAGCRGAERLPGGPGVRPAPVLRLDAFEAQETARAACRRLGRVGRPRPAVSSGASGARPPVCSRATPRSSWAPTEPGRTVPTGARRSTATHGHPAGPRREPPVHRRPTSTRDRGTGPRGVRPDRRRPRGPAPACRRTPTSSPRSWTPSSPTPGGGAGRTGRE